MIGQSLPRPDIPSKVDGSAKYGLDMRLPNMVYAVIRHCPTFGGTLAATPAMPAGAIAVVPVQVAAGHRPRRRTWPATSTPWRSSPATTWDAMQAAKRLSAEVERCRPTRPR